MLTLTHDGAEILLTDPAHRHRWQHLWRALGLVVLLVGLWFGLVVGGLSGAGGSMLVLAVPLCLVGGGLVVYSREQSDRLLINHHYVRIERNGAVHRSFPLHEVHGASIYDEQLVLHTDAGDEHFWMLGRDLDEAAEVALLIEEQLDRFKAAHGTEDVPEALRRMVGEREL